MKLHNEKEAKIFEEALNKCEGPVFAITDNGTEFDLTSYEGKILGFAEMLNEHTGDVEIFNGCYDDFVFIARAMKQIPGAVA